MSYEKQLINKGKRLAFLLRHDKEAFDAGLIDKHGWRLVSELIREQGYTPKLLDDIVATNNKNRYEYSDDKRCIRARQGHSIPVDVELQPATPPDILYHGTSEKMYWNTIIKEGLKPMSRLYVHLSADEETAEMVGKRHSKQIIIIRINAKQMAADGYEFFLSTNGVWLVKEVPAKYFMIEEFND